MDEKTIHFVVRLASTPLKVVRLEQLQKEFAGACNLVAKVALKHKCWNRVALHHLAYRIVREAFPQLGSQMACNAVLAVIQTHRVYSAAKQANPEELHPNMKFLPNAPVYFDGHTLSFSATGISLFTPDGRLRFDWQLGENDIAALSTLSIKEATLRRDPQGFFLNILLIVKKVPVSTSLTLENTPA